MNLTAETPAGPRSVRRPMTALFSGVALMNTAMIATSTAATLAAAAAVGAGWSGAPNSAGVIGTSVGALALAAVMARRGRRAGLLAGYGTAGLGTLLGAVATLTGWLPLLVLGMLLVGAGNAAGGLARYAAADLYPAARQGFAVGVIVWAGTIGGVLGPNLLSPTAGVAERTGLPELVGPFLLGILATGLATLTATTLPRGGTRTGTNAPDDTDAAADAAVPSRADVRLALVALVTSQMAMVTVMTMTPVHVQHIGGHLHTVGLIISGHVVGMFALSPLSGRVVDRYGSHAAIVLGSLILFGATLPPILGGDAIGSGGLGVSLFLLGFGWNLALVGGSGILGRLRGRERTSKQGLGDSLAWGASAAGSLASGAIFAFGGYSLLAGIGAVLALVPLTLLRRGRPGAAAPGAPGSQVGEGRAAPDTGEAVPAPAGEG